MIIYPHACPTSLRGPSPQESAGFERRVSGRSRGRANVVSLLASTGIWPVVVLSLRSPGYFSSLWVLTLRFSGIHSANVRWRSWWPARRLLSMSSRAFCFRSRVMHHCRHRRASFPTQRLKLQRRPFMTPRIDISQNFFFLRLYGLQRSWTGGSINVGRFGAISRRRKDEAKASASAGPRAVETAARDGTRRLPP